MKNGKKSKADGRFRAKEGWFDAGTAAFERVFNAALDTKDPAAWPTP